MNTFTSFCIGACIFMIFVGMSIGFIGAMGAFPTIMTNPFNGENGTKIVENLSGNITGTSGTIDFASVWGISTGALIGGAVSLSILTKTTNMIAVWLFGSFFWSSWASILMMINSFAHDFFGSSAGLILVAMISVGMIFMFIGAIIGLLSGSIWMR